MQLCRCHFGSIMYLISGIICIIGVIVGLIDTIAFGYFLAGLIVGLCYMAFFAGLTAMWAVGIKSRNPCLKTTYAVIFGIVELGLGSYGLLFYVYTVGALIAVEIVHAVFVIALLVGICQIIEEDKKELEAMRLTA